MQPDFLQKIRFSQNFGESAKIGQKSCFSCFSQNLVYRCIYLFCLNWSSYMLYTILSKLHIGEKSGSQIMAKNGIIQSDFSNMNISRLAGRIELTFFLRSKVIQRNTMNAEWFHIPARACACLHFSPRIFLPFFCWILIDVYNFLLKIVLHNGPRGSAKTACPGKSYFLSYSWKCYQSMKSCMML